MRTHKHAKDTPYTLSESVNISFGLFSFLVTVVAGRWTSVLRPLLLLPRSVVPRPLPWRLIALPAAHARHLTGRRRASGPCVACSVGTPALRQGCVALALSPASLPLSRPYGGGAWHACCEYCCSRQFQRARRSGPRPPPSATITRQRLLPRLHPRPTRPSPLRRPYVAHSA